MKYQNPNFDKEAYRKRRNNRLRGQIPLSFKEVTHDLSVDIQKKVEESGKKTIKRLRRK